MDDLKHKIDIVLNEEKRAYSLRSRLGSFSVGIPNGGWRKEGEVPNLLVIPANLDAIQSPNATVLLKLYSSLKTGDKESFKSIFLSYLSKDLPYAQLAYLIFFVLHRVGETMKAVEYAKLNLKGNLGFYNMLAILSQIVTYEHSYMGKDLLQLIKNAMESEDETFQLFEKINSAEVELLKKELSDVNPEINKDRERVINLWAERFGSAEVTAVFDEIEEYFTSGNFTPTKFATCIGRVRALLVEVLRRIAIQISEKKEDKKINKNTKEHTVFDYLRSQKFISNSEWQMIKGLYALASDEGAHDIVTLKEYARIAKNMTYELILLVLSK